MIKILQPGIPSDDGDHDDDDDDGDDCLSNFSRLTFPLVSVVLNYCRLANNPRSRVTKKKTFKKRGTSTTQTKHLPVEKESHVIPILLVRSFIVRTVIYVSWHATLQCV